MTLLGLQIGGALIGAVIGAGVGFSQVLCPDGSCAITGTWFGGAVMGGIMGFALVGVLPIFGKVEPPEDQLPEDRPPGAQPPEDRASDGDEKV